MGQTWRIIAPHERETLATIGKLGEGLFDGSPSDLVELLVVPIIPDDFYLDCSERLLLSNSRDNSRGAQDAGTSADRPLERSMKQGQREDHPAREIRSTKRMAVGDGEQSIRDQKRQKSSKGTTELSPITGQAVGLSELPTELLDLVFSNLDIYDVIATVLLARGLWKIARRHIRAYHIARYGRWAGKNIICIGDSMGAMDNPAGVLDEWERKEVQDGLSTDEQDEIGCYESTTTILYDLAEARYRNVQERNDKFGLIGYALGCSEQHGDLSKPRISQMRDIFRHTLDDFYPANQSWILRNLTTKEYVHSGAIAVKPEHICGPHIGCLGFGEVVLSRICWSPEDSTAMGYQGKIHQGVWAGHKFDITTVSRHRQSLSDETTWKDVSTEVAAEIAQIWEAEYGSDWRNVVSASNRWYHGRRQ